ncbi:MAG: sigma 54-interacting transcriptional regulator, partial [Planctomycetota bacterium]|nr:sigma 54-interacting transcriptional regulator [Planctomycetota bacterium]
GETGTGKGLIARKVHEQSGRRDRSFVQVDCGAIPPSLIESELFGHEKGAFTGATTSKPGHFALADGGTFFLDEIGELPHELQVKLLRVLSDGEVQRIGATEIEKVDVRIIAATNRDLERAVDNGEFRSDLYYRLAVFPIVLPPLRERREDIPLLTTYFVSRAATSLRKTITVIPAEATNALVAYDWPGNIRELRNVVERAMILSRRGKLELSSPLDSRPNQHVPAGRAPEKNLAAMERRHIVNVLEQCGGKIKGPGNAAEQLGLKPSTLRSRMKKLEILRPRALNEAVG